MVKPCSVSSIGNSSSVATLRGKRYVYCTIDTKQKQRTLKNPHTISFFCDNPNITAAVSKDSAVWSYKYLAANDSETHFSKKSLNHSITPYKRDFKSTDMVLSTKAPRLKYTGRKKIPFTGIHWGQRKLLASEVLFFLDVLQPKKRYHIVYAGAACGTHILLLINMFKQLTFTLVDPAPFDARLAKYPTRINILQIPFTNTLAHAIKARHLKQSNGLPLIFISDIRTQATEDEIRDNMEDQMKWTKILTPEYALLKFRLPWDRVTYDYLDGTIYKQIWQTKNSTETRLLVKPSSNATFRMKSYDCKKYEDQLFYHNMVTRTQFHNYSGRQSTIKNRWMTLHMDRCFDCVAERWLLHRYIKSKWNTDFKLTVFKLAYKWTRFLQRGQYNRASCQSPMCKKWNTILKRTKTRKLKQ